MAKDLTVKDVLYALEYMRDALVRTPISDGRARWNMRLTGASVKESVANQVRASGSVSGIEDTGTQIIVWRVAA
ncbi:hypothetical protein WH87_04910 [Devosia epidermidihirudinis]|uniref:Uncharacterized protein n=1 Tax=Devosia epidermidihirudinis TaxID=1293439 RepID=A0A0F5QHR1_9HYPH|nr:hypothetical protein [Devosia epidermidihirudinis]KKC39534.1 hypothetical protein WH87_04910 [Devosia epidermidihirudinis]